MKANNKYYILLLLCFLVWEMQAQDFNRIRVRYGAHDNIQWQNDAAQNEALRAGANEHHTGTFQVPAVGGAVNTHVMMWGAGGGAGGSAAISLISRIFPLALPTSPPTYASSGGGGGGGFNQGSIGLTSVVPTLPPETNIADRIITPFSIQVGAGGLPGTSYVDGGFVADTQIRDGLRGGDTWVTYGNTVRAGGGDGSRGRNITFGLLYAIAADPFSIADVQSSNGGHGGTPQNYPGSPRTGNWSTPITQGLTPSPASGNAGEGGGACNANCSFLSLTNRIEGAIGGAGGRVANFAALTGEFGASAGIGGDRQVISWTQGLLPGTNMPAPTEQTRVGMHGVFPGGGAGGSASIAYRRLVAGGFPIVWPHDAGAHSRGGAGANGMAFLYMDIFAEPAATPQLRISYDWETNQPLPVGVVCSPDISYLLVVENPQPVRYEWERRPVGDNQNWQTIAGAEDPYLAVFEEGVYRVRAATHTGVFHFPGAYDIIINQDGLANSNVTVTQNGAFDWTVTVSGVGAESDWSAEVTFLQRPIISNMELTVSSGATIIIGRDDLLMADGGNIIPNATRFTWTVSQNNHPVEGTNPNPSEYTTSINLGTLINPAFTTQQVIYRVIASNLNTECNGIFYITVNVLPQDLELNLPPENTICVGSPFTLGNDRTEAGGGTWSVSPGSSIVILPGSNGEIFASRPDVAYITFTSNGITETVFIEAKLCELRVNHHIRSTWEFNCVPMTTPPTLTPAGEVLRLLYSDGTPQNPAIDTSTEFRAIAFSEDGRPVTRFEWFVDGELQQGVDGDIFVFVTPNIIPDIRRTYEITVRAYDDCTGMDADGNLLSGEGILSDATTVIVEQREPPAVLDFVLSGQVCFDVRMNDHLNGDPATGCLPLSARVDDFEREQREIDEDDEGNPIFEDFATRRVFTYTLESRDGANVSGNLNILEPITLPNYVESVEIGAPGSNTVIVTFRENVHALVAGRREEFTLRVGFTTDTGDGVGTAELTIQVQDCACGCRVRTVGGGWLTFMCYNLGADPSTRNLSAREQEAIGSSANATERARIHGYLFQWGRQADGHELRNSMRRAGRVVLQPGNLVPPAAEGRLITNSGTPYTWHTVTGTGGVGANTDRARSLWDGNAGEADTERIKTLNDPCPPGWRMPTIQEWQSILNGNANQISGTDFTTLSGNRWRWVPADGAGGTGTSARGGWLVYADGITPSLYLPSVGYRSGTNTSGGANAVVPIIEQRTAHYWSSTALNARGGGDARYLMIRPNLLNPNMGGGRIDAHSVRCVME